MEIIFHLVIRCHGKRTLNAYMKAIGLLQDVISIHMISM